jgi:hypothetical protein
MTAPTFDAWTVSGTDFPVDGSAADKLRFLLGYAVLAPSSHNTQPWSFQIRDGAVRLLADRTRSLPVVDPGDRALVMSCGAALLHLRVAMRHFGYAGRTDVFPDPHDPDLLAVVHLGPPYSPSDVDEQLFGAIPRRRTNRHAFEPRPVPPSILSALVAQAAEEGAWLEVATEPATRNVFADLVAHGDRVQANDKRFRAELSRWVHPNHSDRSDGIPGYALGMSNLASYAGPFVLRTFDWGEGRATKDRELAESSPVLAVLGTRTDDKAAWLAAGQAAARVLLGATAEGLSASFLNQPIEVEELRPRLRALLLHRGAPQLMFRFGYGPFVDPTPRRSTNEVLTF